MINSAAPRASRELGVLTGGNGNPGFSVELVELLQHHRARRHIDAKRQGLRGEDDFEEFAPEKFFHDLLEHRQHSRVMGGHTAQYAIQPRVIPQHSSVVIVEAIKFFFDKIKDGDPFVLGGEGDTAVQPLRHRLVTSGTREDKEDRGEQICLVQQ